MVFEYGETEVEYLKKKDKRLGLVIETIGPIRREVNPCLFGSLINAVIGQQISAKAQKTVWNRMVEDLGNITPETVCSCSQERIQRYGMTFRKAAIIQGIAEKVRTGALDLQALSCKVDAEVCAELCALDGIGIWTAEMLMIFSMQRPNVISYGDLAIRRGLCMLHRHKTLTRELFEKYRRRYSPYASVASLYLWELAAGTTPIDFSRKG